MSSPAIRVFADILQGATTPYGPYADISAYVIRAIWNSGLSDFTQFIPNVGNAEITVKNLDRRFTTEGMDAGSPYPNLGPGRRVEIWLNTVEGDPSFPSGFTLKYVGEIDDISPTDNRDVGQRQVVIKCIDAIGKIQNARLELPLQLDKTTDQLLAGVVNSALGAPAENIQLTFAATPNNGDTIMVAYTTQLITYTFVSAGPVTTPNQVLIGGSASVAASNFAAAFNNTDGLNTNYGANVPIPGLQATWDASTGVNVKNQTAGVTGAIFVISVAAGGRITVSNNGTSSGGGDYPLSPYFRYLQGDLWAAGADNTSDSRFYRLDEISPLTGATAWNTYLTNIGGAPSGNGTATGTTGRGRADYICDTGYSRYFNGTSDTISIVPVNNLQNNKFTVSFWMNADNPPPSAQMVFQVITGGAGVYSYMHIALWAAGYVSVDFSGGTFLNTANGSYQFGKWQFVVVVIRNLGCDIYINGVLAATSGIGTINAAPTAMYIGTNTTYFIKGYLKDFGVHVGVAANAAQVARWYPAVGTRNLDAGAVSVPIAGDDWRAADNNGLSIVESIVRSENGRFTNRLGKPTFRNQSFSFRQPGNAVNLVVNNNGPTLYGSKSRRYVYNRVETQNYGSAALASTVIAKSDSVVTVPGNGSVTVTLPFIDPITTAQIAARTLTLPLVPTTDWVAALDDTGYGSDFYTVARPDYLKFAYKVNAASIEITITSTATGPLQMIKLQVRGTGITRYNPVSTVVQNVVSQLAHGIRALMLNLPYNKNQNYAAALAQYWLNRYSNPAFRVTALRFPAITQYANGPSLAKFRGGGGQSAAVMALAEESIIQITDATYRITNQKYQITGMRYTWELQRLVIDANLERVDDTTYWILGDPVYGVLGTTSRLSL